MAFKMDDYVDVAQRIADFYERFPDGSLRSGSDPTVLEVGGKFFIVYHAQAWRTPDDSCPSDGWAWEPIPGPTPYTKDSELMNAETSAWGRAIVALGFATKKIASADEVRSRQQDSGEAVAVPAAPAPAPSVAVEHAPPPNDSSPFVPPAPKEQPTDGGDPAKVLISFGKYKGRSLGDVHAENAGYLSWLISDKYEAKTAETRRIVGAAKLVLGMAVPVPAGDGDFSPPHDDSDIPF